MQFKSGKCLFDTWHEHSAPMLHTSSLWPAFSEANIQEFLTGTADSPVPSRELDAAAVAQNQHTITAFMQRLQNLPGHEYACRAAYLEFEADRLNNLELIVATDPERIMELNDLLYGPLSSLHQAEVLGYLKWYIEELQPRSPEGVKLRRQLLEFWRDIPADPAPIQKLCAGFDQIRLHLRPLVERRFAFVDGLMAPYRPGRNIASETVRGLLDESLGHILGDRRGDWSAIVKEGAPNVFIDNGAHAIVVPAGRQYEPGKISSLIIHEIGAHVTRSVNGFYSQEKLASCGMAGYGPAEESFGALLGAVHDEAYDPTSSFISFAVIDFATREGSKTFREVHGLTQAFMTCRLNPSAAAFEQKHADQARLAFARVIRASRKGSGAIIERSTTKYWRGLLLLQTYFETHGLSDTSIDQFLLGKYDCLNPDQLKLITTH